MKLHHKMRVHDQASFSATRTSVAVSIVAALAVPNAYSTVEVANIETIQVKGQINSLIIESEIDLSASSSPDLRSQISQLPGVNVNGNGRVSGIVQYRGLFSDRVRVSIDDVLIAGAGPNAMDSPLSHVIGNLSQQVTLYHSIAPETAGAETLGGAIDISDIPPDFGSSDKIEFSGALTLGKFSNDGESATGVVNAVNQNAYVSVIADIQQGDSFESGNGLLVPNTDYERDGIKINAGYMNGAHKVSLFVSQRNTDNSGTPALAMDIEYVDALVMGLNYQYEINNQWTLKAKLAGNNNEHDMNNYSQRPNAMPAMYRLNSVDSEGRSASLQIMQQDGNWQNDYGVDVRTTEHNSRITNPNSEAFYLQNFNDVSRNLASLYAQWQYDYDTKSGLLNWQLGARVSNVSMDADVIDSNMAMMNANVRALRDSFNASHRKQDFDLLDLVAKASFGITDYLKVQSSAAIKQKAPSYNQLYSWFPLGVSAGLADGRNYLGNLDLEKESAAKIDIGFLVSGKDWVFAPNIFYADISDYIIGVNSTNMPANMIANMNNVQIPLVWENQDAKLSGIDFTYNHNLPNNFMLSASGQYVRAKQVADSKQDLYRISPLSMDIAVHWNYDKTEVSMLSRWVAAQNKVASLQNETPSAGYVTFDIHASYEISPNLRLSLLAENILDKQYADHLSGINRVAGADIAIGDKLPSAGRNIGAFISYQF